MCEEGHYCHEFCEGAGNVFWVIFGLSPILFLLYSLFSLIFMITIIGIPIGKQIWEMAKYVLWPFGNVTVPDNEASCVKLGNIVFCPFGAILALIHMILGCVCFITIVGIPFGQEHFMFARLIIFPFGVKVLDDNLPEARNPVELA